MERWHEGAIEYSNLDDIKKALVGRSITNTISEGSGYERVLSFVLDDGSVLKAHATDGGCCCTNGCFTIEPGSAVRGTIMNVELSELVEDYDYKSHEYVKREVEPGSTGDGSAKIRLFVYTDLEDKALLIESEGADNGYYGWGFWLSVHAQKEAAK